LDPGYQTYIFDSLITNFWVKSTISLSVWAKTKQEKFRLLVLGHLLRTRIRMDRQHFWNPDLHQSRKTNPDPLQSVKPGAVEAYSRAREAQPGAVEAHTGSADSHHFHEELNPDPH
jgi:hypothetical protein